MRCAYYGNAELSVNAMKAGFARDRGLYVFATMYNNNLFSNHKLRKFFEEEQLAGSDLTARYLKNFELKRKEWPFLESFLSSDVREEAAPTKEDSVDEKAIARAAERGLTAALHKYIAEIFRSIYKALLVIVGVYLVYKYGLDILGFLIAVVSLVGHAFRHLVIKERPPTHGYAARREAAMAAFAKSWRRE